MEITGPHSLTAQYSGDGTHAKSTSSILVQKVNTQATTTTLSSSPNPSKNGQSVTFTATVTPAISGTPTGTVRFRDNGDEIGTGNLTGNTARFSTSSLGPGAHSITATYIAGTLLSRAADLQRLRRMSPSWRRLLV